MKTNTILLAAAALALAACAAGPTVPTAAKASQIKQGVTTRAEVDSLMGKPAYSFAETANRPAESTYDYHDSWGQDASLAVTYDKQGVVQSTYSERQEDH
jgi:outer membrane protein assembly factor BamE (lipoprotein component of BamABCDE complex)